MPSEIPATAAKTSGDTVRRREDRDKDVAITSSLLRMGAEARRDAVAAAFAAADFSGSGGVARVVWGGVVAPSGEYGAHGTHATSPR